MKIGWLSLLAGFLLVAIPVLFILWVLQGHVVTISGNVIQALLLSLVVGLYFILATPGLIRAPALNALRVTNLLLLFFFVGPWAAVGVAMVTGPSWAFFILCIAIVLASIVYIFIRCPECGAFMNRGSGSGKSLWAKAMRNAYTCPSCGCDLRSPKPEAG
jgi:hypothetical protein